MSFDVNPAARRTKVTFSELRSRFREICKIIADVTGYPMEKIRPSTALNHEIGADGMDAWEVLDSVGARFSMNAEGFVLTQYFSNTEPPYPSWYPFLVIFSLPLILIYLCIFLLIRPFGKLTWGKVRPYLLWLVPSLPSRRKFTVGQLVAWSYTRSFVAREKVIFVIER